ncbi:hypothetical protein SAMN04488543_0578 [Friedmanniella luteola]|uniref:YD repeat-containing protein n=1 Tax=Friedmanniella luteola TaxID=546871 RepID=A0A1H1MB72_9ACTN|nr:hypothetical protein [Friedmanniella luteola]SDR83229.1 hypothetical protein SAMN04488543_0578 [Friedmanniella luteola]
MKLLRTAGALLLAALTVTACTAGGGSSAAPVPTPAPRATASPDPAPSTPATPEPRPLATGGLGTDGLTVRYQDRDGSIKTLRVEDFPR